MKITTGIESLLKEGDVITFPGQKPGHWNRIGRRWDGELARYIVGKVSPYEVEIRLIGGSAE